MLVAFMVRHKDLDARAAVMAFATKNAVIRSTGFTPAALLLGRDLRSAIEHSFNNKVEVRPRNYVKYAQHFRIYLNETLKEARKHSDRNEVKLGVGLVGGTS